MSSGKHARMARLAAGVRRAFAMEGPLGPLTEADRELLRRLALAIVARRMGMPALLFLRSMRPLNYVGSQALVFLRPFVTALFQAADYDRLTAVLERREGIGALVEAVEAALAGKEDAAP